MQGRRPRLFSSRGAYALCTLQRNRLLLVLLALVGRLSRSPVVQSGPYPRRESPCPQVPQLSAQCPHSERADNRKREKPSQPSRGLTEQVTQPVPLDYSTLGGPPLSFNRADFRFSSRPSWDRCLPQLGTIMAGTWLGHLSQRPFGCVFRVQLELEKRIRVQLRPKPYIL